MQFKRLFETGQIGKLTTRNKLVMAPMSLGYTEYPYNFTRQYIDAIEERAKGGVGLIITAHVKAESAIDPYPIGEMFACLDREYNLRNFAELTEVTRRKQSQMVHWYEVG